MNLNDALAAIKSNFEVLQKDHNISVERNCELFKVLATVKNDLEKVLKKPETLKDTVYSCIDLLRKHTPYYSANEGVTKIDPPLTEEQKVL